MTRAKARRPGLGGRGVASVSCRPGNVRLRNESSGFSLVEVLVTILLMALAVPAILGALASLMQAGATERSIAQADQVVRTYSEGLAAAPYVACAPSYPGITLPSGYSFAAGPTVKYWNGDGPATFATTCTTDNGVQQISATIKDDRSGTTQRLLIGKSEAG